MIKTNYLAEEDLDRVRIARDGNGTSNIIIYERSREELLQRQIPPVTDLLVEEFGVAIEVHLTEGPRIDDGLTPVERYAALKKILVG